MLGSLAILTRAQRPLNTTTNGTAVLLEPFFVKPTSISSPKNSYPGPDQTRISGSGSYYSSIHDPNGIRNKEGGMLPPLHQNTHLDMFNPPLGGQPLAPQVNPANKVHVRNPPKSGRGKAFNALRDLIKNPNATRNFDGHSIGKKVSKPEPFIDDNTHDDLKLKDVDRRPSSEGKAIQMIKDLRNQQDNQHTPSPPSNSLEDVDSDETMGVKCSFEKPCSWTFDNVTGSNFKVTTGAALKASNITGKLTVASS